MTDRRSRETSSHFKVESTRPAFNTKRAAHVTVSPRSDGGFLLSVRPLHDREYVLPLEDVAELVVWKVVKAEARLAG